MGVRYSVIGEKNPREIVLLKGYPCKYGKCKFCNYIEDNSNNDQEIKSINFAVLDNVNGIFGVLEVLNSGSVFELPLSTLEKIRDIAVEKDITLLYFEVYYGYLGRLNEIREFFKGIEIRFRMGIETFDNNFRIHHYGKRFTISENDCIKISQDIYSICLLICTKGQTKEMIQRDIELGLKYFNSITVNVFVDNGTEVQRDELLVAWFVENYSHLKNHSQVELLIDNKDLGVFEQ
ncbi:MAG: radical SAM protein [Brevinemataceae bacterium]